MGEPADDGGAPVGAATGWVGDDVGRVLVVLARPDDLAGVAPAVARWRSAGRVVGLVLATRGEVRIDTIPPEECGPVRESETRGAAAALGITQVEFLDHHDGILQADLSLRADLATVIRRHRPDTILTVVASATGTGVGCRHVSADHRALGTALLDAVDDAANRWIFPEVVGPPHRTGQVLIAGSADAGDAIDVSGQVASAVSAFQAHATYLGALGDHPAGDVEVLRAALLRTGAAFGVEAAIQVERVPVS